MNKRIIDTKIFKILSYVFILWTVGLASPYLNEKDVKFHIGQGMILNVISLILFIVVTLFNILVVNNAFVDKIQIGGSSGVFVINETGIMVASILRFSVLAFYLLFSLIGIFNVLRGKDKFLPIFGKYSFIKKII